MRIRINPAIRTLPAALLPGVAAVLHATDHAPARDQVPANLLLRSLPEVDADKAGLMGISWGGVITSTVIGIEPRFAFAIPTYGCGHLAGADNQYGRALGGNATAPQYSPSRAGLMSGCYPQRFGHEGNPNFPLMLMGGGKTIADHLKAAGYATAHYGKWHLGFEDEASAPGKLAGKGDWMAPTQHGFDESFGYEDYAREARKGGDIPPALHARDDRVFGRKAADFMTHHRAGPFIVQWKGRLPAGKTYDRPVSTLDVLPAAVAAAQARPPDGVQLDGVQLDGVNILPFLLGENADDPHGALFWRWRAEQAIRMGDWKPVRGKEEKQWRLIDLGKDVGEKNDLAAEHPEKAKELLDRYEQWAAALPPVGPSFKDTTEGDEAEDREGGRGK